MKTRLWTNESNSIQEDLAVFPFPTLCQALDSNFCSPGPTRMRPKLYLVSQSVSYAQSADVLDGKEVPNTGLICLVFFFSLILFLNTLIILSPCPYFRAPVSYSKVYFPAFLILCESIQSVIIKKKVFPGIFNQKLISVIWLLIE